MARNDGIDRTTVRNANLSNGKIGNVQRHNEREKQSYINQDIVLERAALNVHFKQPDAEYMDMFRRMEDSGAISTRGLKEDATHFGELIFDVNSAYFHNHGGYEYAKQFFEEAYKSAVEIVGGEQYVLSAVMHADERNRGISEALGQDVYHYHMHVVYVPVVEKQILWSKRCKDEALRGTAKETIVQVSSSKKWLSKPALDDAGQPILQKNGKPVLRKSYSVLQDDFYNHMRDAGYTDLARGERGSSEEHLTVTQFKAMQEEQRLDELQTARDEMIATIDRLGVDKETAQQETAAAQAKLKQIAPRLAKVDVFVKKHMVDPDAALPEAGLMESARSYRENKVKPFFRKIIKVMIDLYNRCLLAESQYNQLEDNHKREVSSLRRSLQQSENRVELLRDKAYGYDKLVKALGKEKVNSIVASIIKKERTKQQEMVI